MHKKRVTALVRKLVKYNISALIVTSPKNIFYLTSFFSDRLALVIGPGTIFAVTDFIYAEAASGPLKGIKTYIAEDSIAKTVARAAKKHKLRKVWFEPLCVTFSLYKEMKRELKGIRLSAAGGIVESLREIKGESEVHAIKMAFKVTRETFKNVKRRLGPEATELSVSNYIKKTFIKKGAEGCSFEPIVASQLSSSQPHYKPAPKKLGHNKIVLVDMGARVKGYNSDLTRMCRLGKISTKFVRIHSVLTGAQRRAIERIRPGVKLSDIDTAARQYIYDEGFGKFFGHALGHGIGLDVHEKPFVARNSRGVLKEGMVFTVEPGIYVPGFGGMRLEDTVRVRGGRDCEILTDDIDKTI